MQLSYFYFEQIEVKRNTFLIKILEREDEIQCLEMKLKEERNVWTKAFL